MIAEILRSQALMSVVGLAVFSLVWLGLALQIRKIARRERDPPRFDPLLQGAHLGRFAGWVLVGGASLSHDPWTGALLIATRGPAVGLVLITFLQRRWPRPPRRVVLRSVGGALASLALLTAGAALWPDSPPFEPAILGIALPAARPLDYGLQGLVLACFAVQLVYALPRQIRSAGPRPLGNLRWFQLALLANYAFGFYYATLVRGELLSLLMGGLYGALFLLQALLVWRIELGVRALRRARAAGPANP